jgi:hypothetical protein
LVARAKNFAFEKAGGHIHMPVDVAAFYPIRIFKFDTFF